MKSPGLAALTEDYIVMCRENRALSENSVLAYQQDLACFCRFSRSKDLEAALNQENILAYLRHLREVRRLKPATVRRRMLTIKAFTAWLHRTHRVARFAFADLELELKLPHRLPRPIDHATLATLLSAGSRKPKPAEAETVFTPLPTDPEHSTALAMKLLLATGIRIGELTHIRLGDVSDGAGRLRIRGKGNRERTVYIGNSQLRAALQDYLINRARLTTDTDYLFLNRNRQRLTEQAFRMRLRRLSADLQIQPYVTPHRFRHSAATLLVEEGIDIRIVQRLLGHASISTTEIYTYVSDTSLRAALLAADPLSKLASEFS